MGGLRNFDLTVDEIRLVKSINQLRDALNTVQFNDPTSPRTKYLMKEIKNLEEKLEEVRENTLIR